VRIEGLHLGLLEELPRAGLKLLFLWRRPMRRLDPLR
jgi:hypothetical protein